MIVFVSSGQSVQLQLNLVLMKARLKGLDGSDREMLVVVRP